MRYTDFRVALLLATAAVGLYAGSISFDFTGWDDPLYVPENPLIRTLNLNSLETIFSHFYEANYFPLKLVLYSLVYAIFDAAPWAYHALNVLLHALCTFLVFRILRDLSVSRAGAALGAAIFLAHPVQVEVVAWVSQTKTLLATAFGLASFRMLFRFRERRPAGIGNYAASLLLFACALLSKPQAIAFPGILFCLERAMANRSRRLPLANWFPFGVLAIGGAWVSILAQSSVGAVKAYGPMGVLGNALQSLVILLHYLKQVLFPVDLSVAYELSPLLSLAEPRVFGAALLLAAMVAGAWWARRSAARPWHALGAFVAPLIPVLGWVPLNVPMADRYLYPAMIAVAWLVGGASEKLSLKAGARAALWVAPVLLALLTLDRMPMWRDGAALWDAEVRDHPASAHAWIGRGSYRFQEGEFEGAESDFQKAVGLDDSEHAAWTNLGLALNVQGKPKEAVLAWRRALAIAPTADWPRLLIARDLGRRGEIEEARILIEAVIGERPDFAMAYLYRAALRQRTGDAAGAEADLLRAATLDVFLTEAQEALGRMREARGDLRGAREAYTRFLLYWGGDLAKADAVRRRIEDLDRRPGE